MLSKQYFILSFFSQQCGPPALRYMHWGLKIGLFCHFISSVQYKTHAGQSLMPFRDAIWKHVMWSFSIHSARFAHEEYDSIYSVHHSISQGYAWAYRGTTIKVGKMQLQSTSNMYLSVESLAMIKGTVNSFLQKRKVFLQRHQISLCHDKLPAPLAKRLRKPRGCLDLESAPTNNNTTNSWPVCFQVLRTRLSSWFSLRLTSSRYPEAWNP